MSAPRNEFKRQLLGGDPAAAIFASLGDPSAAEICALVGFDLVIVDAEHGPNDITSIVNQLRAIEARGGSAGVRAWNHDQALIKRILDLGAQTLVVPMVENADQASRIVEACRYPTAGSRGVATGRAAGWGTIPDYHSSAADELCLIVQVESPAALEQLEAICAVDGVDAVFVGPTDLSSAMGLLAQGTHPDVIPVVADTIRRITAAGLPAGVFASSPETVARYTEAGARFVAVGVDAAVLRAGLVELRSSVSSATN